MSTDKLSGLGDKDQENALSKKRDIRKKYQTNRITKLDE